LERLTPLQVRRLGRGWHNDGGGLYLRVDADGGRYWFFRWGARGAKYLALGPTHTIGLARAREKARAARELLIDGRDPKTERAALRLTAKVEAAKRVSFADCVGHYFANHRAAWSPKHARDWRQTLRDYAEPMLGALPVGTIDTALVLKVLEPVWASRTVMAGRLRARIESVLDFAKARGFRDGDNPARWRGHLDHLLPAPRKLASVEHYAALPYADISAFMGRLSERDGVAARALEFTILTAARAGESCGARWDEISGDVWTVPAARMKSGREHRVPLSGAACDVLARLPRAGHLIFPGRPSRAVSPTTIYRLAVELGAKTTHGFRSAFRDWAGDKTGFPREVAEAALAHVIGDETERAYRRGDALELRRELMEAWARHCSGETASTVVPFGVRRHG
jgi:integrase